MYDVIIIGAGPAGISASLYTTRANLKTLILYNGISNLEKANKIQNYYGFEKGIKGRDLYLEGIRQSKNIGARVIKEEVVNIEINNGFYVKTSKNTYNSKAIILATGNKKSKPEIEGVKKFEGKGISYCAICDGFFFRNKNVAVLGSGNYAISEANDLLNIAKQITILTNGERKPEFRADNVEINTKKIDTIVGNEKVEEVQFKDGTSLKTQGIFIAQGIAGSTEFAKKLGIRTNKNEIIVNNKMETNIKGMYACGDCTGGILQISKAVYQGTVAGLEIIKFIKGEM